MTPPDRIVTAAEDRKTAILDVIRGAKRTLSLALFRCTDKQIFEELAQATARGVAVDALVTARARGGPKKLEKLCRALEQSGVAVSQYNDPVVKYHAKYLVADEGPTIVASLNFTKKCFTRTVDALVITYDPDVAAGLRDLLRADRSSAPLPTNLSSRLIVGPECARRQLSGLIGQAQNRVRLIDAKLSDSDLLGVLKARRDAGVTVEVFNAKRLGDLRSHGKILLVDGRVAVVGSLALTALSLGFRREVALTVDEPSAVADLEQLFDTVAKTATSSLDFPDSRKAAPW